MWMLQLFVVIFCISVIESENEIKYPLDADVYIGGFFSVYVPLGSQCSDVVLQQSIEMFEAARWTIDKLNQNNFLPGGLKLGIHAVQTCGIPEMSAAAVLSQIQYYNKPNTPLLFSLLSPETSSEAKTVSRLLSSLPEADRLLMLSFSATSTRLTNQNIYKNFFRVIPPDNEQVKVMVQLMLQLKWNYVGIIYEDDDYGMDGANELRLLAKTHGICIPTFLPFNRSLTNEAKSRIFDEIDRDDLGGLVYIGQGSSVKWLLRGLRELSDDIELIVSESVNVRSSYFLRGSNTYFKTAHGALATSCPVIAIPEFAAHWKNQIQSNQSGISWIQIAKAGENTEDSQSVYVYYVIKAVAVLADLFKKVHARECPSSSSICSQLRNLPKQYYIDAISSLKTNLTATIPYILEQVDSAVSDIVTFGDDREIAQGDEPNNVQYEVYNFQICQLESGFCFQKVGDFRQQNLQMNVSLIKMYPNTDNINNIPYPELSAAQCPNNADCPKCLPSNPSDNVLFVEGDWYIVGVVSIYGRSDDNDLSCGDRIHVELGTEIAESIQFAVKEINNPNGSFVDVVKGSMIGLIILDDCETPLVIKDKIIRLHKGTYEIRPGLMSSQINHRILGYVGGLGSSMSTAVAEVLTKLGYVQVSMASTSPRLSDRTKYPYFLRIPTADDVQAKVIIDTVKSLGSNYIQVLYNRGPYGEGGLNALRALGESHKICIAQSIEVPSTNQASVYYSLLPNLRKEPNARLVVTFFDPHIVQEVMAHITEELIDSDGFIFIGSESWGRRESVLHVKNNLKLLGFITISLELPFNPDFAKYMAIQKLEGSGDPWLREFLETRGKCIFPGSFARKDKSKLCNMTELTTIPQDPWVPFTVAATYALVLGVRDVLAFCRTSSPRCPQKEPGQLANYMQANVQLPADDGKLKRVFNDNGDGVVDYTILQINRNAEGELKYKVITKWSSVQGMKLEKTKRNFALEKLSSNCETEFECMRCFQDEIISGLNKTVDQDTFTTSYQIAVYALSGAVAVLIIICIVLMIKCCRHEQPESHYVHPDSIDCKTSLHANASQKSDIYLTATPSCFENESYTLPAGNECEENEKPVFT